MSGAEWRVVPGFPDYDVSNDGRVRSRRRGGARILQPGVVRHGYLQVQLFCETGKRVYFSVHHLVLLAFVGPRPAGMEVCHNNGKPNDNRIENLRWDTRSNNHADKIKHGTAQRGSRNPGAKLTFESVNLIRSKRAAGIRIRVLSKEFGVCPTTIDNICHGRTWHHPE